MSIKILQGDCREVMATLPESSVDAIVCDPPYELTSARPGGRSEATRGAVMGGFMGMKWDGTGVAFDIETWRQALRVLKPGGHLLAFSGTRTYHRMVCAIEDAGFEIRDQIGWLYGSGFPKSLDVSKAIDKAAGAKREVLSEGKAVKRMIPGADQNSTGSWVKDDGREFVPTLTAPATDEARQWEGWGTALKPAWEPIVLARKPLVGTVAANVLQHGTGALNIDGCRVTFAAGDTTASADSVGQGSGRGTANHNAPAFGKGLGGVVAPPHELGRWPANIIHDGSDEALAAFPQAPGQIAGVTGREPSSKTNAVYGQFGGRPATSPRGDGGSAARFFYSAKADQRDRSDGLQSVSVHGQNNHPTVKPTDLMRYLCRLVTPPSGTVLDPFMGSGSTLKAAELEGFSAIGIELDPAYIEIAKCRIASDAPLFAEVEHV